MMAWMRSVAPHAGAWIEMLERQNEIKKNMSRPTRARGLKCQAGASANAAGVVAPHAGAWIEIRSGCVLKATNIVAPHAGAWIEIV